MTHFDLSHNTDVLDYVTGVDPMMQFTGLLDKNGKEVYEGDIVDYKERSQIGNAQVIWNGRGYFELLFPSGNRNFIPDPNTHNIYGFVVIGNIYENPELLTNKDI